MKSIQGKLLAGLLVGQGILWVAAAVGVWYSVRARLYTEFDNELRFRAASLRFYIPSRTFEESVKKRWPEFEEEDSDWYYQAWRGDDTVRARSSNLGESELPRPEKSPPGFFRGKRHPIGDLEGPGGESLRGIILESPAPHWISGPNKSKYSSTLLLARSRELLDQRLALLAGAVLAAGLLAAGITALMVRYSVRVGLRPLREMGEQASRIDVTSLDSRFERDDIPAELKPISSRFNDLMERLEEGFRRERRFSADLEHELRTPLAELKSIAELVVQWPEEASGKHHEEILAITLQMQGIMESLLALSRYETDSEPARVERVEVGPLIEECWSHWGSVADGKEIETTIDLEDAPEVETDRDMLRLIVSNLVSNAVEYTPANGAIHLVSKSVGDDLFRIANRVNGFDPEDIPRMTDRFWRHDPARTGTHHSGLGLSVAAACAERLHLDLLAEFDEEERQLEFRVRRQSPGAAVDPDPPSR